MRELPLGAAGVRNCNTEVQNGDPVMKVALDTNCLIDAFDQSSHAYEAMQRILNIANAGRITLAVSRHTLAEISSPPAALELANSLESLPYWPIGTIAEQVATIAQLTGTWEDAARNEGIQLELKQLAKSGNDIRDRGAYLDALGANADVFVTTDRHFAGSGPARRIRERFRLRVTTPTDLLSEFEP